jgi:hypothetical protein
VTTQSPPDRPPWQCPSCGRRFANRNQTHTCADLGDLDARFVGTSPPVRAAFDAVLSAVAGLGPVTVLVEKTRIALQVRMSFAALVPRRAWLAGWLTEAYAVGEQRHLRR